MKRLLIVAGLASALLIVWAVLIGAPDPASADPGTLVLTAALSNGGAPLVSGQPYTLTLQLNHNGGTSPAKVRIDDDLPGGLYLDGPVNVQADKALPAQVVVRAGDIGWQGVITPSGGIRWRVPVVAGYCPTDGSCQITRTVTVAEATGGVMTETVVLDVAAAPIKPSNISVEAAFEAADGGPPLGAETFVVRASNANTLPVRLRMQLLTPPGTALLLGDFEPTTTSAVVGDLASTTQARAPQTRAASAPASVFSREAEISVLLAPGETQEMWGRFRLVRYDLYADGTELPIRVRFCLLDPQAGRCTLGSPAHLREITPITYTVQRRDLGDAPDSTNHFAAAMTAYPAVPAAFPTVFDPTTGLPQGPAHIDIRPFHLGRRVSPEAMADLGPDADGVNNLVPPAGAADLDRGDDGVPVNRLTFQDCRPITIPVRVFVHPLAVTYFQETDDDKLAYLNIWVDSNRDGDWDDIGMCGSADAAEHTVVDAPVDVTALGAGIHTLSVVGKPVRWPQALAQQSAWIRVTLSERPSNKTLSGGAYGDGRGYAVPFATGETEDYLYVPQDAEEYGPDVEITGFWQPVGDDRIKDSSGLMATRPFDKATPLLYLQLRNRGTETAKNVTVSLLAPSISAFFDVYPYAAGPTSGDPDICTSALNAFDGKGNDISIGNLPVGCGASVVLGYTGCLTCPRALQNSTPQIQNTQFELKVTSLNDVNASNDTITLTSYTPVRAPQLSVAPLDGSSSQATRLSGNALGQIGLIVSHPPGAGGVIRGENILAYTGCLTCPFTETEVPVAAVPIQYQAAISQGGRLGPFSRPVEVACVNGVVKGSLHFTDGSGRVVFPESGSLGSLFGDETPTEIPGTTNSWLTATIRTCGDLPVTSVSLRTPVGTFELTGQGGGIFNGGVVLRPESYRQAVSNVVLTVEAADAVYETVFTLTPESTGSVFDAATGKAIADAQITVLTEVGVQAGDETTTLFAAWEGAPNGQANPFTPASDGSFSLVVPDGRYQLLVTKSGYQPYRTSTQIVDNGILAADVPLTPEVVKAPDVVVNIDESGFSPAVLSVTPGAVVEFRNLGTADHGTTSDLSIASGGWDSGLLATGETFRIALTITGTLPYSDPGDPANYGQLTTDADFGLFLPMVTRLTP